MAATTIAVASDISPSFLNEKYYGRQAYSLVSKKNIESEEDVYVVTAFNNTGDYVFSDLARKNEITVKNQNPTVSFQFSYPFVISVHKTKSESQELHIYNVESKKTFSTAQEKDLKIAVNLASEESLFCVLAGGSLLNIKWQDPKGSLEEMSQSFEAAKSKPIQLEGEEIAAIQQFDNKLSSIDNNRLLLSDGLQVFLFDTLSGKLIFRRKLNNFFKLTMIEHNDDFVAGATSVKLYIWNIADEARDYEVSTELSISAMQIHENMLVTGNVKGLVEIYDMPSHNKGQPFHNVSSMGANKKNFKELMEARVNWICFVNGFLLVLVKDKINVWDISLDERFVPLKSKTLPGKKHRFLMFNQNEFFVSHFNADKEQEGGQIDVYNWKPNVKLYKKLSKRVKKSAQYQQITESVVGKEMLKTLTSDKNFVNVLFQSSYGARVDVALIDSFLRVFNEEGRLTDLINWAVDIEVTSSDSVKQDFKDNWGFILKDDFPSFELLFYDTRITTQIILRYLNLNCKSHMRKMFGEVIAEVLKYDKELQVSSMVSNKKRTKEEKVSAKNAKKLIKFATKMIDSIIEHKSSIPTQMVTLLQRIDSKLKTTFSFATEEIIRTKGIASIMFEKFYCRALAAPDASGLTREPISAAARYNLSRLSMLLESIALGKPVAEPPALQDFCKENMNKVNTLIDTIANKSTFSFEQFCLITKHVSQKRITKSLNPDQVMIDKDYFMIGGFVLYMSPKIIDSLNESISQYLPVLRKFKQKAEELPEAQQMCNRCVGDIADEEEATDYIQQTILKAFAPPGTFPEDDDSEMESSIESRTSVDSSRQSLESRVSTYSLTSIVSSKSMSSVNSSLIPNVGFLTKSPEKYDTLADWLNDEISKHRFLVLVVFRGSWCPFCNRYMQNWNKYFQKILAKGGMLVAISSENQRSISKTANKWGLTYPVIGEPENTVADHFMLNVSEKHGYVNGMAQPAVLVFSKKGKCVYSWKSNPKLSNAFGALERPKARDVMKAVFNKLAIEVSAGSTSASDTSDSSDTDATSSVSEQQ